MKRRNSANAKKIAKRSRTESRSISKTFENSGSTISDSQLKTFSAEFSKNPANIISRNAITSVGSVLATMNSTAVNKVSHVFSTTLKRKHVKATNQGASGRCWMFAALNTFRHVLINALNLENFEFSQVYLFFWDKLERANSYLTWFINSEASPGDRAYDYMLTEYLSDGGWYNTFANLVDKYGLIPQSAMKETFQSDDSEDMNRILKSKLNSTVNYLRTHPKLSKEDKEEVRLKTIQSVYDTLVKFLGEPPSNFDWTFTTEDEEIGEMRRMNSKDFLALVAPDTNVKKDFIALSHIPHLQMYRMYEIKNTNNVVEGDNCKVFNVPINELKRYAKKSIQRGMAVWFVGDVQQSFNYFHASLDDSLDDSKTVFGKDYKFEKQDRILLRDVQGNHAMILTGFNENSNSSHKVSTSDYVSWQVENSWGFQDHSVPGKDGFLYMSDSWFEKYVTQIVVHKKLLSRTIKKRMEEKLPIQVEPWESCSPALRAG